MPKAVTLEEVDETAIRHLVDTDPRKLTVKDRKLIIHYLRENRQVWLTNEQVARATGGRTARAKLTLKDIGDLDLDLESL